MAKTTDNKPLMRPLIFGEVLFDHFSDGSAVLGGAPFNVAWHLHAFGLKPLMLTRIGNDALGDRIAQSMKEWGMDCSGLQRDETHPTGTVEVTIHDGEPAYNIVDNVAYDYIDSTQFPPLNDQCGMLYHGSLALRHEASEQSFNDLISQHDMRRIVDINLRPPWWKADTVAELLQGAEWVKLNRDELRAIFPHAESDEARLLKLSGMISKGIVLTGGEEGAMLFLPETMPDPCYVIKPETSSHVVDVVGAGDAFCSVFMAGLLLDWTKELCMQRAQQFASAIVGIRGATSSDKAFYEQFREAWGIKESADV